MRPATGGQEVGALELIVNTAILVSTNQIGVIPGFLPGFDKNV